MANYPNARNNPAGAIPVYLSSSPKAMPVVMGVQPTTPNAGAIPVYFVSAPTGSPPFPNDQGNANSAIPVIVSAAANAMPVWDTAPAPPPDPPIANDTTFTANLDSITLPDLLGVCTCQNGPGTWSVVLGGGLNLLMAGSSGQLILMDANGIFAGTYNAIVQVSNANGNSRADIEIILTSSIP
jgi:hypothetical protein